MLKHRYLGCIALIAAATGTFAEAAIITSVNRATFQTAVANQQIAAQNFDSLANGTVLETLAGVNYSASTGLPIVTSEYLTSTSPNGLGRTGVGFFLATDTATFAFATPISAFAIDINTFANQVGDYRATLNIGDIVLSLNEVFPNQTTGQFVGFVSNTTFSSVTISANQASSSPNRSFTLDTLIYGNAAAIGFPDPGTPVPEPNTYALLLAGLVALKVALPNKLPARWPIA